MLVIKEFVKVNSSKLYKYGFSFGSYDRHRLHGAPG